MVKFVQCVTRKQGMEAIEFRNRWNEYGAQLETMMHDRPNVLRFRLSTTLLVKETVGFMIDYGSSAPYDGMVELWLDDATITSANLKDPKNKAILGALVGSLNDFIDRDKSTAFFASEDMGFDREPSLKRSA